MQTASTRSGQVMGGSLQVADEAGEVVGEGVAVAEDDLVGEGQEQVAFAVDHPAGVGGDVADTAEGIAAGGFAAGEFVGMEDGGGDLEGVSLSGGSHGVSWCLLVCGSA